MLIDTHCHLDEKEYNNLDNLIVNIFKTDVKMLIVSGYDVESSKQAIALAHKHFNIYATVGFHPNDCKNITDDDYNNFDNWLKDEKVIGIGEIGLDYYYGLDDREEQIKRFKKQLDIALKYHMPVIIHNRAANEDVYNILKDNNVNGIIHCFSEDIAMANKFIALGFALGIGGILTFKNSNLKNVIKDVDIHNIVLETDSPYLAPVPYRGTQNSPMNLPIIAKEVAKIKKITYSEAAAVTTSNVLRIFDLKHKI